MQEAWHPSLRVIDIIERSETFILPLLEKSYQKPSTTCLILYLFDKVTSSIAVKMLIILFAIFIRIICNLMYYETAFRSHYNTITHTMNNNIVGWYKQGDEHEFQSYPPLYGYLYCLIGSIQKLFLEAPIQELGNSGLRISANSEYDYRTNNYICIIVLTLLEAATFYSGVYMCIKSFYRKLTNQVKHSIIFLALICPVYLIANVLAIRFNSIMIGLMIWAVYFCINSKAKLCVFCTALAIHIEPKAFIFVIPMMIYTIKVNVVTNVVNNHAEQTEMKHLIKEITDKTFSILGSYIVLFAVVGLIWLPWILIEDFNGMVNVIYSVYLPESDFTFLIFKSLMFLMIMIYNLRALVIKTSKKVILITLFNLSVGYCICFTMNADSISLIITCGFLACYELREISFMIIVSCLYSIYPDVIKQECYSFYFITAIVYFVLYKIFMRDLLKLINQEGTSQQTKIDFFDSNQDQNLDSKNSPMVEHKKCVPIIREHYSSILRYISSKATLIETSLCIGLFLCMAIEVYFNFSSEQNNAGTDKYMGFLHNIVMRVVMMGIVLISHLILSENLSFSNNDAFSINVKEKNS